MNYSEANEWMNKHLDIKDRKVGNHEIDRLIVVPAGGKYDSQIIDCIQYNQPYDHILYGEDEYDVIVVYKIIPPRLHLVAKYEPLALVLKRLEEEN